MTTDAFPSLSPTDRGTIRALEGLLGLVLNDADDVSVALQRVIECHHIRERLQDDPIVDTLSAQSGRDERTVFTHRGEDFLEALAIYPALKRELVAVAERHHPSGPPYRGLPVLVYEQELYGAGWSLGARARMRLLRTLTQEGFLHALPNRWFTPVDGRPSFPPEVERLHGVVRFMELLTRTISQRLSRVEGGHFSPWGYVELPERIPELGKAFMRGYLELLSKHAIPWSALQRGSEQDYAVVHLAVMTGVEQAPAEQARLSATGLDLMLSTLGADISRRIGNVDASKRLLRGVAGRTLLELAARSGESLDGWLRQHHRITLTTCRNWSHEPTIDSPEGAVLASGGFAGVAAVQLMHALNAAFPGALSQTALQQRMRQLCSAHVADPGIVSLALNQLEADDQVMKTVQHGEKFFAARRPALVMDIKDFERAVKLIGENIRPIKGLVGQVLEGSSAGWSQGVRLIVPREVLPWFEEEGRKLREVAHRNVVAPVEHRALDEQLALGNMRGLCISQACITPVHLKRRNKDYR